MYVETKKKKRVNRVTVSSYVGTFMMRIFPNEIFERKKPVACQFILNVVFLLNVISYVIIIIIIILRFIKCTHSQFFSIISN